MMLELLYIGTLAYCGYWDFKERMLPLWTGLTLFVLGFIIAPHLWLMQIVLTVFLFIPAYFKVISWLDVLLIGSTIWFGFGTLYIGTLAALLLLQLTRKIQEGIPVATLQFAVLAILIVGKAIYRFAAH